MWNKYKLIKLAVMSFTFFIFLNHFFCEVSKLNIEDYKLGLHIRPFNYEKVLYSPGWIVEVFTEWTHFGRLSDSNTAITLRKASTVRELSQLSQECRSHFLELFTQRELVILVLYSHTSYMRIQKSHIRIIS